MKSLLNFMFLFPVLCISQTTSWDKIYDLNQQDDCYGIVQSSDGGYVLTGSSGGYDWPNLLVMKLDGNGDTVWSKIYADAGHSQGFSICKSPDNGYVVSGFTCENEFYWNYVMYILKVDENGDTLWTKKFGNGNTLARRVISTLDGGYAVLGVKYAFAADQVIILKLNELGEEEWAKIYDFNESPYLMLSLEQSEDSSYILAGQRPSPSYNDIWLMKLDKFGDTLWTKTYGEQGIHETGYYALPATDGGYIISATRDIPNYPLNEMIVIKTNNDGNILWEKSYGGLSIQEAFVLRHTLDFGYIACGRYYESSGPQGMYVIKLNYEGDTSWTQTYESSFLSYANDILQTEDFGYIVCGGVSEYPGVLRNVRVLKLDENGLVSDPENKLITHSTVLRNYPNPFDDYTYLEFEILASEPEMTLTLFDATGKVIRAINPDDYDIGLKTIYLETRELEPGIYYCSLKTKKMVQIAKMIKLP